MQYATGLPMEVYDKTVINEYEAQISDAKAMRQARIQPLRQALKVFKWVYGFRQKWTIQHDPWMTSEWNRIKKLACEHYGLRDIRDISPELLGEFNQYAIGLIIESQEKQGV